MLCGAKERSSSCNLQQCSICRCKANYAMKNLFNITGKTALVTGASSGMGKAIAEALGAHGATVIISSNDEQACIDTTEEFVSKGITASYIVCDIANKEAVNHLIQSAEKIDILVSCVGVATPGSTLDITSDDFEKTMSLNLQSAVYLSKLIIPQMQQRKDGVIIFLASIAGVRGNKSIGLYGVSKAGLIQLAKNLAVEFGPDNIRVNTISPGLIDTPFSKSMLENKQVMERRLSLTPLRRVGQPHEIAGVAVMLASKAGAFITGQNIIVDGGTVITDGN
jgi:NAD(P)-dependent dehydrogenase (short-subunit alcohol dehydrogenase family)